MPNGDVPPGAMPCIYGYDNGAPLAEGRSGYGDTLPTSAQRPPSDSLICVMIMSRMLPEYLVSPATQWS
jgi:hypothetical protein